MLERIIELDESLFLWLNQFHVDWLDPVMYFLTHTKPWIPFYIFLIFLIFRSYGKQSWWVIFSVLITILFADQTASGFMKPFFERLRPCHNESLEGMIHHYGNCSGMFGFASSHAANSFGIATSIYLGISFKYPQIKWLFLWAAFFSYTRIYLGVHYPGDILVGALVGVLSGLAGHHIFRIIYEYVSNRGTIKKIKTD